MLSEDASTKGWRSAVEPATNGEIQGSLGMSNEGGKTKEMG